MHGCRQRPSPLPRTRRRASQGWWQPSARPTRTPILVYTEASHEPADHPRARRPLTPAFRNGHSRRVDTGPNPLVGGDAVDANPPSRQVLRPRPDATGCERNGPPVDGAVRHGRRPEPASDRSIALRPAVTPLAGRHPGRRGWSQEDDRGGNRALPALGGTQAPSAGDLSTPVRAAISKPCGSGCQSSASGPSATR